MVTDDRLRSRHVTRGPERGCRWSGRVRRAGSQPRVSTVPRDEPRGFVQLPRAAPGVAPQRSARFPFVLGPGIEHERGGDSRPGVLHDRRSRPGGRERATAVVVGRCDAFGIGGDADGSVELGTGRRRRGCVAVDDRPPIRTNRVPCVHGGVDDGVARRRTREHRGRLDARGPARRACPRDTSLSRRRATHS